VRIFMAKDRYEVDEAGAPFRILVQTEPITEDHLPPGARGRNWERREREIPDSLLEAMLAARISPASQDRLHRAWWSGSAPKGVGPWPE
jgi:hypothetical protein